MQYTSHISNRTAGFTLIELSIVLVIIGLIVGGILTGQDLINAATVRAQISQIEKYQAAVRTFQGKYGYLPGDMPNPYAANFAFPSVRGTSPGQGDGNGLLEGYCSGTTLGWYGGCGENAVFWVDLSYAGLIDAGIKGNEQKGLNYPYMQAFVTGPTLSTAVSIREWLPAGKIGNNTFVYSYSVDGFNYLAVSAVTKIGFSNETTSTPGLTVHQAFLLDSKIDDGLPQSGGTIACYVNQQASGSTVGWVAGGLNAGAGNGTHCVATNAVTPYAATNCYDNSGSTGVQKYSLQQNANIQNCALSFRFQ